MKMWMINHISDIIHSNVYTLSCSLLIETPFQSGMSLEQFILPDFARYNCEYIYSLLNNIIISLSLFHNNSIVHGNIKPSNIFINNNNESVSFIDHSQQLLLSNDSIYSSFDNVYYQSPEIIQNKYYGISTDIWSLGCVLHFLFYRTTPLISSNYKNNFKKIRRYNNAIINSPYPAELNILIQNMIKINPNDRYKCNTIIDILNNPKFLKSYRKTSKASKTNQITSINLQNPSIVSCITHSRPYRNHHLVKDLQNCIYCLNIKLLSYNLKYYSNVLQLSLSSISFSSL